MIARKKYDHFGIEIGMWNRDNVVNKIECDCGQLANKVRGKHEFLNVLTVVVVTIKNLENMCHLKIVIRIKRKEGKVMKNNQMEIKLKEIMDKQGMTLDELKRNVQIDPVLLDVMYNEGLFDDTKVGVQTISELMIALNISKVNELVPKVK